MGHKPKKHAALNDIHIPYHNKSLETALDFLCDWGMGEGDELILNGDIIDCQAAGHWNEALFKRLGPLKQEQLIKEEIEQSREVLHHIRRRLPKPRCHWVPGNHEVRLWHSSLNLKTPQFPFTIDQFDVSRDLSQTANEGLRDILVREFHTEAWDIRVLKYYEQLKLDRILYLHGHQFGGANPLNSSARKYPGSSLVMGHHHTHAVKTIFNQGSEKDVYQHVVVPCLSDLQPGYLKDDSTMWLNGFWIADFDSRGYFDGRVVKIFDGKIVR